MRLLLAVLLVPLVVQSETLFLETEITTLIKSTGSLHIGTSAGMKRGELYLTYMEGGGQVSGWSYSMDFDHKSWGAGYRHFFRDSYLGSFWGFAIRSADVDGYCTSGRPGPRFSKHTAAILSYGKRFSKAKAGASARGYLALVFEGGIDYVNSGEKTEQKTLAGISIVWGVSFL